MKTSSSRVQGVRRENACLCGNLGSGGEIKASSLKQTPCTHAPASWGRFFFQTKTTQALRICTHKLPAGNSKSKHKTPKRGGSDLVSVIRQSSPFSALDSQRSIQPEQQKKSAGQSPENTNAPPRRKRSPYPKSSNVTKDDDIGQLGVFPSGQ